MATSKRIRSRAGKKVNQRVLKFPEAKGKIIAEVELSVSPEYFIMELQFEDKTALSFNLEPRVSVVSKLVDWNTGNYKLRKRWQAVHSESPHD